MVIGVKRIEYKVIRGAESLLRLKPDSTLYKQPMERATLPDVLTFGGGLGEAISPTSYPDRGGVGYMDI
ncbi:MAG TPA: hypothetical protein DDZ80_01020, partial [Cyanobacteria bacterium UBA8803]|nr:hypothetical protein [Cyanobacteria bacterium UBA8803]